MAKAKKNEKENEVVEENKKEYKKELLFAKVSEKQIVQRFESKEYKDIDGNPFELARVVLPDKEHANHDFEGTLSIVVPAFTISDDKFKDDFKVLSIDPNRTYQLNIATGKGKDRKTIKKEISGKELKQTFSKKDLTKQKSKKVEKER